MHLLTLEPLGGIALQVNHQPFHGSGVFHDARLFLDVLVGWLDKNQNTPQMLVLWWFTMVERNNTHL